MRVLHIIGTLNPESGGPASSVLALIRFAPAGCVHEVVTFDAPGAAFLKQAQIEVSPLGPVRLKYGFNRKLISWLRANADRFDGVVVHGLWQFCGFAAWRTLPKHCPYLVFVHGMLDPYFKRTYPAKHIKKWIYWLVAEYWILRGAYRVLFTCPTEERLARQTFWLNRWTSHVVSYGASVPEGDHDHRRQAFLGGFPALKDRRYLLFLGRIDRKKGCDLLIQAFLQSAALDPELDLVIAGPDRKQWRRRLEIPIADAHLSSRVHWTGMLEGEQKWGAFLCSEAFILPSHQENFGIAIAEAMGCGKAVLLSDKVNIALDVRDAGAGLMEADTLSGTRRLMERWIAMPSADRLAMAEAARRTFEKNYDMRVNACDIAMLIREASRPPVSQTVSTSAVVE